MNPAFSGWRSYALVEPPVLLCLFGQTIAGTSTYSLLIDAVSSSTEGTLLNKILIYKTFVDGLLPALVTFFLAPWSDRYGRKPLLVAAYAGSAVSFLLWSVLSSLRPLNPWIFLVASVPSTLVGGYYSVILTSNCYITDIRQESDRGWHLTWMQSIVLLGPLLGSYAGPKIWITSGFSYATVLGVASVANAIALIYVLFLVPETVTRRDAKQSWCILFNPSLIKDTLGTWLIKREGFDRVLIWSCVSALAINRITVTGERNILYSFTSARLGWDGLQDSRYSLADAILIIIGTFLGGLICKAIMDKTMSSMSIVVLANASALASSVAKAFTTQSWHFYLSAVLGILGGLSRPMMRNALSKSAPQQETGKVFSLTTLVEAIIPLGSDQLYTMAYSHYPPPLYPSPVYLFSAAFYAATIAIVLMINWRISKLLKPKNPPITAVDPEVD